MTAKESLCRHFSRLGARLKLQACGNGGNVRIDVVPDREPEVFARSKVRHSDHKTIFLDGWHCVYMNRERFAPHAVRIAFLD